MTDSRKKFLHFAYASLVAASVIAFGAWYVASAEPLKEAVADCEKQGPKTQQCLNDLVISTGEEKGLEAGFDALAAVYVANQEFAGTCHGTTHELGIQAFNVFEKGGTLSLNDKTSYCGFGFFHGFMEILLQTGKDLSEARVFCEDAVDKLRSSIAGVTAGCYHGIGHGVVDGTDPAKWGDDSLFIEDGIELCEKLTTDEDDRERCASGVFNALAIAYDDPKYDLSPDPKDPYRICRKQTTEFTRKSCYDQLNGFINRLYPVFTDALRIAEMKSETAYREMAISAVAGYRAQPALVEERELAEFIADCDVLSAIWRNACAKSFAVGLIEFGNPKREYIVAVDTCAKSGDKLHACLSGVADAVRVRLDPSVQTRACEYIDARIGIEEGDACRAFMSS